MVKYKKHARTASSAPTDKKDITEKIAKGSAEFMEQTSSLFQKMSFLNCTLNKQQHNDNLVHSVILVPSTSITVQSDVTDGSISDQPQFTCQGALQEWMIESEHRKVTRQKADAVKKLRESTRRNPVLVSVLPLDLRKTGSTFEHEGILFATNDTPVKSSPSPGYSKSLFWK